MGVTKSRSILVRASSLLGSSQVYYRQSRDSGEVSRFSLLVSAELIAEMGDPEVMTLTLEPGDTLNP